MGKKLFFQIFFGVMIGFFSMAKVSAKPNGSLSGVIKDKSTGMPIQGASVMISDIKIGVSSNEKGNFYISNITEGKHLVEVSHLGYATIAVYIVITGETKHDFLLETSIIENNAVVVTGVSKATQLKKIPFQVSVLRKEDLMQTSSMNIIESITSKAGVSSVSTGPAISKPLIRGLGYNRVLTINDGVRQEGQQWGDEHGIEIDDASVNKIEVLKGPASLVYGSDAMAGVINIISNVPAPDNTIKAAVGMEGQSNNYLRGINGNISGNRNGFNWNAYGTIKEAADYKNKYDGYVFNSKFNQHNVGGYVGYNGNWGFSHLLFSNFNLKAGLVEGERDSLGRFIKAIAGGEETAATDDDFKSTNPTIPYQHIQHFKIATDNSIKLGQQRLTFNIGWQQNKREEFGNPDNLNERSLYFDLQTLTYATQLHLKETKGWKNSIGINGMQQQNRNKGVEQLIPNYQLFDFGTYIFSQKEINKLNLSGGIRFDIRNINVASLKADGIEKGTPFTNKFSNYSGSLGLAYPVGKKINVKFNIARAFRAPSIPELASNGAHEGTIRYEFGDKNLTSEISTQSDAAIEYNEEHFSLNIAGYWNHFSNFIYYRKLESSVGLDSIIEVDGNQLTAFKFDQKKADLKGIEATLDIHPHPLDWLHIENTFSLVSGKFSKAIEGSRNLPFMPAPRLLTEFRGDFKKVHKKIKALYVKVELDNTFSQNNPFTAYNTETKTVGYTLLNLGLGVTFVNNKKKDIVGVYFTASNLMDVAYQNHLSRLKYASVNAATGRSGVFNVGRNFGIKINMPLGLKL
jgi:iron complex outermembrane receptor protein